MQRQQHQAEADEDAADILDAGARAAAESDEADDERTGATAAILNDRTCTISVVPTLAPSMIASAGTRPTRPSAAKELVIRPVAVLLWNSAVRPMPAANAVKRLPAPSPAAAQVGTEGAQNAAVDHVQAPQQQRDAAHQVEKNHASHDLPLVRN